MYKPIRYHSTDLMSDLICENYPMILVLNRFGISLGFGDSTIDKVCEKHKICTKTFLSVVNLLISEHKREVLLDYDGICARTIVEYLHNSHEYYLEYKLPYIRQKLINAIGDKDIAVSTVVINYYDHYVAEVKNHMMQEENILFPYIKSVLYGTNSGEYNIDIFEKCHENIEFKLTELKNILIKYYPAETTYDLSSVLFDIFTSEIDLASHNEIEDFLLVPIIRVLESKKTKKNG